MGCITSGPAFSVASVSSTREPLDASTHIFDQKDRFPADLVAKILDEQLAPVHNARIDQFDLVIEGVLAVLERDFLTRGVKLEDAQGYSSG